MSKKRSAAKAEDFETIRRRLSQRIGQLANLPAGGRFHIPSDEEIKQIPPGNTAMWDFAAAWVRSNKHLKAA